MITLKNHLVRNALIIAGVTLTILVGVLTHDTHPASACDSAANPWTYTNTIPPASINGSNIYYRTQTWHNDVSGCTPSTADVGKGGSVTFSGNQFTAKWDPNADSRSCGRYQLDVFFYDINGVQQPGSIGVVFDWGVNCGAPTTTPTKTPVPTPTPTVSGTPVPALSCVPTTQYVSYAGVGWVVAIGGTGSYSWSDSDGHSTTGGQIYGYSQTNTSSTNKTATVTVTSGGQTATCSLIMLALPTPTPTATPTPTPTATPTPTPGPPDVCTQTIDVVLVLDRSKSMTETQSDGRTKLEWAKGGATSFVNAVANAQHIGGTVRVGVASFGQSGTDATLDIAPTSNYTAVKNAIAGITNKSAYTCIECGVRIANNQFATSIADFKGVVLLSDGQANRIWNGTAPGSAASNAAAVTAANNGRAQGEVFYAIGFGTGSNITPQTLQDIAGDPSRYLYQPDVNTWNQTFENIAGNICNNTPPSASSSPTPTPTPTPTATPPHHWWQR